MKIKAFLFCLAVTMTASAQKSFTLEDLNFGGKNYRNMVPRTQYHAWWGDELVRLDKEECRLVNKKTGKETPLFNIDDINHQAGYVVVPEPVTVSSLYNASFPYAGKPLVLLDNGTERFLCDFRKKEIVWLLKKHRETSAEWNADSRALAYVQDDQLFVNDGQEARRLTTDGSREIVYGQSVHRDEFGISKGLFWSPDGMRLAFYRMDQSMVKDYPQVNIFTREADYEPDKYPMAGETSHKVTVGVYDLKTRKTLYLQAGDPTDRYFTNISWSPDNQTIYMFELNRDQNDCCLVSYDATTGAKIKELYRETHDKYVEPMHPIVFLPWDASRFIMQSQKDGYNHLYLFDRQGKQLRQITSGKWEVENLLGFDRQHKAAIIESNELSPIQKNLFSVNIATGKRTLIDETGDGWHAGQLSASGRYIRDSYSAPEVPHNISVAETGRKAHTRLLTADDPWKGYTVPEYSMGTLKAADGTTDLYYRMVKPVGFDPSKKYPTVVYVYGGPHAHNVDARWHYASRSWETYMAQKGYLLFILDNRGSENRGRAFEQATFRQLGTVETEDQMQGVKFLQSLPYVDSDRIGVHGWSFGGFMTITLMTHHPEVFKVGVAGGPVIDWKYYEVMYGERYMDTPQSNPEGYEQASLLRQAKNLKGKLQVIIGYNDKTCVPQHSLAFLAECIKAGTQPDFFAYPGEPHNMRGHQSVHLHERITQYFEDYLKPLKK
ncbi:DPP IV N-terminal domain-containing protein [Prevotella sp. oral taxon 376]|uniref:S9 family peptidase n=1 Tax=Prevotella sp. oral taxon 376 TaxID=712466 RepID=UPI00351838E2